MAYTSHAKTVDALLQERHGTTLEAFLTDRRTAGDSYFQISRALARLTGGAVDVTGETIRNWTLAAVVEAS